MRPEQFLTHSLQDHRIARILHSAIEAVEPAALVTRSLKRIALPAHKRLFLLALGKAAEAMIMAAAAAFPAFERGLVITKHRATGAPPRMTIMEAGHPIPDHRSVQAGRAALKLAAELREDDLLVCLISGGGSALVTAPFPGVSLEDLRNVTTAALASGATIDEINVLRRQLDRFKGGGLASATKAHVIGLILSDVMGDPLEAIASGPTVTNPTSVMEARAVLAKYQLSIPAGLEQVLLGREPKAGLGSSQRVANHVIGNNALALDAALRHARHEGFESAVMEGAIRGEAAAVGRSLAARLASAADGRSRPFCLLGGGETTVTLESSGRGGRNQELALASVDLLAGLRDCLLITLATDGNDGPTDAAGAVVTGQSGSRAAVLGLSAGDHLTRHDSYAFFAALGDLLKPGYTGTNVNDIVLLLGL
jgi:hydroxypyruvate reductase